jgi:signal transduction histidine kinase
MTLRARLGFAILAIGLVLGWPLWLGLAGLEKASEAARELQKREFSTIALLGETRAAKDLLSANELSLFLYPSDTTLAPLLASLDDLNAKVDSLAARGLDSLARPMRAALSAVREAAPLYERAKESPQPDRTLDSLSEQVSRRAIARLDSLVGRAENRVSAEVEASVQGIVQNAHDAIQVSQTAVGIALVVATLIAIWLTATVSRPVKDLEAGMGAVADGDFGHRLDISPSRHDEFGRLATSFRTMAQQLRQLDQLKAEFVSVASHELKTPINVIIGYLQLLQENVYGDLTPKQREICTTLTAQAQSLSRLVRQLLDVSRFEAGGGKLELRSIRLSPFLNELENAFHVLALQRGVRFRVERSPFLPDEVFWDEDRMSEVLGNLLSNAFKFTDRGGSVELSVLAGEDTVHMTVRDTGAGIPPAHLPYIFEKFFQADNQSAASMKGTGLGLAIAKSIVEAHGGSIMAESTPGLGTMFSITLPVIAQSGRQAALAASAIAADIEAGIS